MLIAYLENIPQFSIYFNNFQNIKLTKKDMLFFSTDEYRNFYKIARNYQTRSLNIDKTSVFFFGKLKEV